MAVECWLCTGKGQGQVVLRPDGVSDGRRVCNVCVRRLFAWLQAQSADALAAAAAPIWPEAGALPEPDEPTMATNSPRPIRREKSCMA